MLKSRLLTQKSIKPYLTSNYAYTKNINSFLRKHEFIQTIKLEHHFSAVPQTLYQDVQKNPGKVTAWDIALSLHPESYLTGYTVLSLLGWTEYFPKVVYVNWIRGIRDKADPDNSQIDNETLQRIAFQPKKSPANTFIFEDKEIHFLSGQYFTRQEQSHLIKFPNEVDLPRYARTFSPERLFIESLINYHHFGGQELVWQALSSKVDDINQDFMIKIYKQMKLQYPYANAIGYLVESFSKNKSTIRKWLGLVNTSLKFHLFMGDNERRIYVEKWSLYVPKRFYLGKED
jgi:hypothetical protein